MILLLILLESTKLRTLRAKKLLMCQRVLRACVLTCQRALRALLLMWQRALSACVPSMAKCHAYLCTHVSTWLKSSGAYVPTCLFYYLCDHVITRQHVLPPQ